MYAVPRLPQFAAALTATLGVASGAALAEQPEAIEEVMVTAQHRAESLQKIPIAVTAFQRGDLEKFGFSDPSGLAAQTPSLAIKGTQGQSKPNVFLRGVGSNDFNATASNAVGFYTDEVFQGLPSGQLLQMFDLDRVEVLRGPQGTLYGRNTTGGAINFIARQPTDEFGANVGLTYGSYGQLDLEGALQLPLSDTVATRIAAIYRSSGGYTDNQFNGRKVGGFDSYAVRAITRWTPSDTMNWSFNLHASRHDGEGPRFHFEPLNNGHYPDDVLPIIGVTPPYAEGSDWWAGSWDRPQRERVDSAGLSAKGVIDLGAVTLTSVTAYETVDAFVTYDSDASPLNYVNVTFADKSWMFSQELRLASDTEGALSWIAGAYFYRDHITSNNRFDIGRFARELFGAPPDPSDPTAPGDYRQQWGQPTRSVALFGSTTWRFTDALKGTVGLRWTRDTKSIDFSTFQDERDTIGIIPLIDVGLENSWSDITGSAALEYSLSDDAMIYASFNRGFKSGAYNGSPIFDPTTVTAVNPEYVNAFEVGAKTTWLDGRVVVNVAAFYNDYKDMQVFRFVPDASTGVPTAFLENAASAKIKGVEVEIQARPTSALLLSLGAAYLDAKYEDYLVQAEDPEDPESVAVDYSGNRLVGAPETHVNATAEYTIPLAGGYKLLPRYELSYSSATYFDSSNDPLLAQGGYTVMNAALRLESPDERWEFTAWVNNLGDKAYRTDALDLSDFGLDLVVHGEPRTFGATVRYRFE